MSIIEQQPAGAGTSIWSRRWKKFFRPPAFLSKANNFEFRPQQQQMAVAVARLWKTRSIWLSKRERVLGKASPI